VAESPQIYICTVNSQRVNSQFASRHWDFNSRNGDTSFCKCYCSTYHTLCKWHFQARICKKNCSDVCCKFSHVQVWKCNLQSLWYMLLQSHSEIIPCILDNSRLLRSFLWIL